MGAESQLGSEVCKSLLRAGRRVAACQLGNLELSLTNLLGKNPAASLSIYRMSLSDSAQLRALLVGSRDIVVCNEQRTTEEALKVAQLVASALVGHTGGLRLVHAVPLESCGGGQEGIVSADTAGSAHEWGAIEGELAGAAQSLPSSVVRTLVCGHLLGPELGSHRVTGKTNRMIADCIEGYTLPHIAIYPTDVRDVAAAVTHSFYEVQTAPVERYVLSTGRPVFPDEISRRLSAIAPHFGIASQELGWTTHCRSLWTGRLSLSDYWNAVGRTAIINSQKARHRLAFFPRRLNTTLKDTLHSLVTRGLAQPQPKSLE